MARSRTPAPIGHKHCPGCTRAKPVADFASDASKSDGLRPRCRQCNNKKAKASYWTKERKQERKARKALSARNALEREHGALWLAQQEKLKAEIAKDEKRMARYGPKHCGS